MIITRTITSFLIFVIGVSGCALTVRGAEDGFTITQMVISDDVTPPSTPDNLTATAVSTSQIDLDWDPSTDNVAVTGYQVFRDSVQVATTTLTSYSDIGLSGATLYAYTVTAFDAAGNISTTSATATATTLDPSVTPPDGGGNPYEPDPLRLVSFTVEVEEYAATIRWETSRMSRSVLRWGETITYEMGSLSERELRTYHATRITGLQPGVRHEILIIATDSFGVETRFVESFMTKALPDTTPPPNVTGFRAIAEGDDIKLMWANPGVSDFSRVRIVKGGGFYPVDPFDGALIYEGDGTSALDEGALTDGPHYYAAFAYDRNGNISSGAITFLFVDKEKGGAIPVHPPEEDEVIEPLIPLQFGDFSFIQKGREVSFIGDEVVVDGDVPLTILIPYDRLPENLKTVLVTLGSPVDQGRSFSFLLRVNEGKTAYLATIDSLRGVGTYPITISVFDFSNRVLTKLQGSVVVETPPPVSTDVEIGFLAALARTIASLGLWFLLLILILLILAFYSMRGSESHHRRHEVYLS